MGTVNTDNCFGCGKDNPVGLRLNIRHIGDKSHIEFEVKPQYCGYQVFCMEVYLLCFLTRPCSMPSPNQALRL